MNHNIHFVKWIPQPNVNIRGTWELLQSCVLAIFFCTATSLHLNIPRQNHGDWSRRLTHVSWMLVNTLAPEIFLCVAMTQYLEARIVLKEIDKNCSKYNQRNPRWNLTQAFYFNQGGFVYRPSLYATYGRFQTEPKVKLLKIKHIKAIIELGLIQEITRDAATIEAYAKQDRLAKSIALAQALWLLVQTSARMAEGLPTSPLEITAVAYIACTFFSWLLWLNKPQGIGFHHELTGSEWRDVISITRREQNYSTKWDLKPAVGIWKTELPNLTRRYRLCDKVVLGLTWMFTASLFGGLHLLAWNYEYPTTIERDMWRYSCIAIIVLPPIFYLWTQISDNVGLVANGIALVYTLARTYNMFEVYFSLRQTPELLYRTPAWTNLLPHF